jgi:hypothetical protein
VVYVVTTTNKVWVSMTDRFMSGWGQAQGKINKLVIECDTMREAEIVEANAKARTEMKHVNICLSKPRYNSKRYLVSEHDKTDYGTWFKPNAFKKVNA